MKKIFLLLFFISNLQILNSRDVTQHLSNFYQDKNVLVTGGCGFIGSYIVEKLLDLGARVTILDDLSTGSIENIAHVFDSVTLIQGDIRDFILCLNATKNIDIIFHLAAFISVPGSVADPLSCYEINVNGTLNLLESARQNNVQTFVLSSSSAIYGQQEGAYHEAMVPMPQSPYGYSKLIDELYCQQYAHTYDMHTVCLRYFNVFGERQNPHSQYAAVVAKFSYNMERNLPITIFGDGLQSRDFVSVQKVALANILMPLCSKESNQGKVFNVATGISITVLELIEQLKQKYPNYTAEILFAPARPGDVKHTSADCTNFQQLLSDNALVI